MGRRKKKKENNVVKEKKVKYATITCRECGRYAGQFTYTDKADYNKKVDTGVRKHAVGKCEECGNGTKFLISRKGKVRDKLGF